MFDPTLLQGLIRQHLLTIRSANGLDVRDSIGLQNYAKEYCTLKFDPGRQQGKTRFILDNVRENEYVFFLNDDIKEKFLLNLANKYNTEFENWTPPRENFFKFSDLSGLAIRIRERNPLLRVWVDESKHLNDAQTEMLYSLVLPLEYPTQFVFLG